MDINSAYISLIPYLTYKPTLANQLTHNPQAFKLV